MVYGAKMSPVQRGFKAGICIGSSTVICAGIGMFLVVDSALPVLSSPFFIFAGIGSIMGAWLYAVLED